MCFTVLRYLGVGFHVYLGGALAARHNVVERRARVTASIPVLMHTYSNTPSPASCVRSVLAGGGGRGQRLGVLRGYLRRFGNSSSIPSHLPPFRTLAVVPSPTLLSIVLACSLSPHM